MSPSPPTPVPVPGPSSPLPATPPGHTVLALVILTVHAGLLAWLAAVQSPTFNEQGHLPAGLSHWQMGRFDLYRVNPPLGRIVGSGLALLAGPRTDWSHYETLPTIRSEINVGIDFVRANGNRTSELYRIARWGNLPFSLLGGWMCYLWASRWYGGLSGLCSLSLWCFSPFILGHGALLMPDVPAAAMALAAAYLFWRWLTDRTWLLACAAGAALGLAQLCKTTLLVLYPIFLASWLVQRFDGAVRRSSPLTRDLSQLGGLLLLSLYVLNLGYAFEGAGARILPKELSSETFRTAAGHLGWAHYRLPLPRDYVLGIDQQLSDFDTLSTSYFHGEWRDGGWWYFYLAVLVLKSPAALLVLLAAAAVSWGRDLWGCRRELFLLAPAILVLVVVSSETAFTIHGRYVIPALGFLFVFCGRLAAGPRPWGKWFLGLGSAVAASESLATFPHSLAFVTCLVGGTAAGPQWLLDSNFAWGQDLYRVRSWLDKHPEARPLHLATFGWFDPRAIDIHFENPPPGPRYPGQPAPEGQSWVAPRPGWYLLDANHLHGSPLQTADGRGGWFYPTFDGGSYEYFRELPPVDSIGATMSAYYLDEAACTQLRRRFDPPTNAEALSDEPPARRSVEDELPRP